MTKINSNKHFLSSVRAKIHRSKGGVGFGSIGRLYTDWRLVLGLYVLLNIVFIALSVNLIYRVQNQQILSSDANASVEYRVQVFSSDDLDQAVEFVDRKSSERSGFSGGPNLPDL